MAEVKWTPQAADDLEGITQFIAADSPYYASLTFLGPFQLFLALKMTALILSMRTTAS